MKPHGKRDTSQKEELVKSQKHKSVFEFVFNESYVPFEELFNETYLGENAPSDSPEHEGKTQRNVHK
jgi:hypothetical protein